MTNNNKQTRRHPVISSTHPSEILETKSPEAEIAKPELQTPEVDSRFMDMAVAMAKRGLGTTAPNPAVGAVVVCPATLRVLGRGWTEPGGRPHAEPIALGRAGNAAYGATLYVTLEPCSHYGASPPCVDAIIAAGIQRVVVGIKDPDPRVAGRGLARLRDAGIAVTLGIRAYACRWLTLGHILRVTERRPFTQLKLALDAAGRVARGQAGAPVWVTGEDARRRGHLLRAMTDAIAIGQQTLCDDNPSLTCRLPGLLHQSPARFILSGNTSLSGNYKLLTDNLASVTWVTRRLAQVPLQIQNGDCDIVHVEDVGGRIWLPAVMENMVARGVTRLLVEGGPRIWRAFDRSGLVDEVVMFRARGGERQQEASEALKPYVSRTSLRLVSQTSLEYDDMFIFRRSHVDLIVDPM